MRAMHDQLDLMTIFNDIKLWLINKPLIRTWFLNGLKTIFKICTLLILGSRFKSNSEIKQQGIQDGFLLD